MDIGAMLKKQLNHAIPVVACSQMQRRRPSAIARMAIDVQWRQQRQQLLFVAGASRFEQLLLPVLARQNGPSRRVGHF